MQEIAQAEGPSNDVVAAQQTEDKLRDDQFDKDMQGFIDQISSGKTPVNDSRMQVVREPQSTMETDLGLVAVEEPPTTDNLGLVPVEPDTTEMKAFVKENLAKAAEEKKAKGDTSIKPVEAEDWIDGVAAGWGMSVSGLMGRGEMSPIAVPEDAGRIVKIASQVAAIAGDVPAMVVGGVLGGVTGASAGAAAGTVTLPVAGTVGLGVVGGVVGTDFGANALPAALRKIMMDHYERGDITTADEFFDRLTGTTWEAIKGGTIGVATMGAGRGVAPLAARAGANALTQTATKTAAEIGTMVTAASALEGHLPSAEDFTNAAIVVGGLGASVKVASKLRGRFAKTGQPPAEVLEQVSDDVVLRQEINAVNDKTLEPLDPTPPKDLMNTPPSQLAEKWSTFYTRTSEGYQRGLDDLASFKLAKERLTQGKELPAGSDPYLLARNYRGVDMKAWSFENQRTVDFKTGKPNGDSLATIYKQELPKLKDIEVTDSDNVILSRIDSKAVEGKDSVWKKLNSYRVAKRAIELNQRGVETGIDIEAAKKVVHESKETLEPIVKRVQEYEARALQYAADSGALSKDEVALIKEMNKDYVPFNRLLEADEFDMGGGSKANPLQKIEGSLKQLTDPEQTSRDNVAALIKYAEKNRIYNRLVDLQENAGENAPQIFRKTDGRTKQLQKNEFRVRREGTGDREVWQVLPEYADALEALNYKPAETNLLVKMLQLPTKSLRRMTALSPDFILRNIFRDQQTATIQSKYGHIPFADALKSIGMMWKNDEAWVSFLESGAFSGGIDQLAPYLDQNLFELNKQTGFMDKAWNVIKFPVHALEVASTMAENVPRFTEFRKSGAVGGDFDAQIRGALAAREVTVDFQKAGAWARVMSNWVPFMNVGLQGTDRAFRAFKENPKSTAALAVATITMPSIFTFLNGRDDSRYKDAPRWQKDLFYVLPTNSWEQAASQEDYDSRPSDLKKTGKNGELLVNNGVVWRIPKPFELGVLFGTLPERALEGMYNKDPSSFKQFDNTIIQALIPNAMPTVAVGVAEHLSNHSFFLDSDIVSPHSEAFLPEERYSSYTSETAKQIAKIIGYVPYLRDVGSRATPLNAPAVIDNYLNVWGGTGGKYIVQLSDALLKEFGVSKKAELPAWGWGDAPFVKAFVTKYPSQKTEPIREFYDRYNTATQAYNSMKKAMEEGDEDRYAEIASQFEGRMGRLQEVYKMLGSANKVLNNLQNSDVGLDGQKRDPSQRTQLMTTTYFQMNEMAKAANQIMNEMETKK